MNFNAETTAARTAPAERGESALHSVSRKSPGGRPDLAGREATVERLSDSCGTWSVPLVTDDVMCAMRDLRMWKEPSTADPSASQALTLNIDS